MKTVTGEPAWQPGALLDDRYLLAGPVGRGGSASVWRARDERLGRIVAVKLLDSKLLSDELALQRLRTEAQALARLRHRHIAEVYDYGVLYRGRHTVAAAYLVMELIDGESVHEVLGKHIRLPWPTAVTVAAQVASGLAAAHARGIVHRDVGPANILIAADGVKIIDFGICATPGSDDVDPSGYLAGTPGYLAPERIDDDPVVHPAADVYAAGVLLYRMLSGDPPWIADTAHGLLTAPRDRPPQPLPHIAGLPTAVAGAVTACLSRNPADRPTAQDLANLLGEHAGLDTALRPALPTAAGQRAHGTLTHLLPWQPLARRRSRRRVLVSSATAAVVVVTVAAFWLWGSPARDQAAAVAAGPSPSGQTASACTVVYRLVTDADGRFTATLAVTNHTAATLRAASVTVQLPGTQQLDTGDRWRQQQSTATADAGPMAAGATTTLPLSGTYVGLNPMPTTFTLDGQPCALTLLGLSGQLVIPSTVPPRLGQSSGPPAEPTAPAPGHPRPGPSDTPAPTAPATRPPAEPSTPPSTNPGKGKGRGNTPSPPSHAQGCDGVTGPERGACSHDAL